MPHPCPDEYLPAGQGAKAEPGLGEGVEFFASHFCKLITLTVEDHPWLLRIMRNKPFRFSTT